MRGGTRQERAASSRERTPKEDAAIKAVSAWVNQFARTLKTCRLYDSNNPTVVRFREDLASSLQRLLDEHGTVILKFTSDDVLFDETSLYPARSRDDNLALPFYHDGIHALTLTQGIESPEVEALLDAVLQVTGQNLGQDDLVTLLWEAHLDHVDVDYVPSEGDVGSSAPEGAPESAPPVPWPTGFDDEAAVEAGEADVDGAAEGRSDDWSTGALTVEIEAEMCELESIAPTEMLRFLDEYQSERGSSTLAGLLAVVRAGLEAEATRADADEFARFLPKVLRQTITVGAWKSARDSVALLARCQSREWSAEGFVQELLQPISIASAVEKLDQQDPAQLAEFVALARELGDPALDWLNLVLGESQQRRTRRLLAETIAELCRESPERLAPWLSDPRWYVVRNVVHILGWIGGNSVVGLLQAAANHPEPRVRQEVVAALGQVDAAVARPVLLRMLDGADTRMFCSVLHQLAVAKDVTVSRRLVTCLLDPGFDQRSVEEKRAIYSALSAVGGDEILPELQAELHKGGWFQRTQDQHRAAVARCIARIGTPAARAVLEDGAKSRRGPLRKACEDALGGTGDHE
jgi:HEAT repeat protein